MQLSSHEASLSNVVYLHGHPTPIVHFLRVTEHRRLDQLLEAGKLPYERYVIEAGYFNEQRDLIDALKQSGCELVLDTNRRRAFRSRQVHGPCEARAVGGCGRTADRGSPERCIRG